MTNCEKVQARAKDYWLVHPSDRSALFPWLEEHLLECNPCALVFEKAAQAWSKSDD